MKTCTLFNSRSGGAEWVSLEVQELALRDHSTIFPLDRFDSDQELIDLLRAESAERVVIVGGDGTVSRTMATLGVIDGLQFGIIPTGTGNDLARSLDIPLNDVAAAWELAMTGTAREMDVLETSLEFPRYLMNATTAGIGGRVAEEVHTETKQTYGALAYWMAALSVLSDPPVYHVRLRLDEQEIVEKDLYAFSVAKGRCAGGGFVIAPDAKLDDGKIHVTVLPALSPVSLFDAGLNFVIGNEDANRRIRTYHGTEVEFEAVPELPCSLDGEKGTFDKLKFKILPRARSVVGGPDAAFDLGAG